MPFLSPVNVRCCKTPHCLATEAVPRPNGQGCRLLRLKTILDRISRRDKRGRKFSSAPGHAAQLHSSITFELVPECSRP